MLPGNEKEESIKYLGSHAARVKQSKRIVLIGAGAVGVQSSMDIRELYPDKEVTLIHSRNQTMNHFDSRLHDIVMHRAKELKVNVILGARAKIPRGGFPDDGKPFFVELSDGRRLETDMVVGGDEKTESAEIRLVRADTHRVFVLRTFPRLFALAKRHSQTSSGLCPRAPSPRRAT